MVDKLPHGLPVTDLGEGLLVPGFVDVQVNGGGGEMVGPQTDAPQLARICAAHRALGATSILPTLITDRPEVTARVLDTARHAVAEEVTGFAGLHLEGPHLDPARHGAHDPALIRPMEARDLELMEQAARDLPALMVTLAPNAAKPSADCPVARRRGRGQPWAQRLHCRTGARRLCRRGWLCHASVQRHEPTWQPRPGAGGGGPVQRCARGHYRRWHPCGRRAAAHCVCR